VSSEKKKKNKKKKKKEPKVVPSLHERSIIIINKLPQENWMGVHTGA